MYALEKKLDEDLIQLLRYSNFDAIGDFNQGEYERANYSIVNEHFGDESFIASKMAMFWLEHKDPRLNCIMTGDEFHCIHQKESDGSFDSSHYERAVMDVLDAVKPHPHLKELILAVDDPNSPFCGERAMLATH
jgi:hypothetical protein